jgi:hypothetical protein
VTGVDVACELASSKVWSVKSVCVEMDVSDWRLWNEVWVSGCGCFRSWVGKEFDA